EPVARRRAAPARTTPPWDSPGSRDGLHRGLRSRKDQESRGFADSRALRKNSSSIFIIDSHSRLPAAARAFAVSPLRKRAKAVTARSVALIESSGDSRLAI